MTGDTTGIIPTMPMAPANDGGGFGNANGGWMWILLIFILLAGGGLGGLGGANAATNMVNNDFLYTQQKIDSQGQALISQTNQLNQSLNNVAFQLGQAINSGFDAVNLGLCNLGHQIDSGFCGVNRNIDQVRFDMAQNTCTITNAIRDEGQNTRALINDIRMQDLQAENLELRNALSNSNQTSAIVNAVRPYPQAAYLTMNPQTPYPVPFGTCGHNPCNPCQPC